MGRITDTKRLIEALKQEVEVEIFELNTPLGYMLYTIDEGMTTDPVDHDGEYADVWGINIEYDRLRGTKQVEAGSFMTNKGSTRTGSSLWICFNQPKFEEAMKNIGKENN